MILASYAEKRAMLIRPYFLIPKMCLLSLWVVFFSLGCGKKKSGVVITNAPQESHVKDKRLSNVVRIKMCDSALEAFRAEELRLREVSISKMSAEKAIEAKKMLDKEQEIIRLVANETSDSVILKKGRQLIGRVKANGTYRYSKESLNKLFNSKMFKAAKSVRHGIKQATWLLGVETKRMFKIAMNGLDHVWSRIGGARVSTRMRIGFFKDSWVKWGRAHTHQDQFAMFLIKAKEKKIISSAELKRLVMDELGSEKIKQYFRTPQGTYDWETPYRYRNMDRLFEYGPEPHKIKKALKDYNSKYSNLSSKFSSEEELIKSIKELHGGMVDDILSRSTNLSEELKTYYAARFQDELFLSGRGLIKVGEYFKSGFPESIEKAELLFDYLHWLNNLPSKQRVVGLDKIHLRALFNKKVGLTLSKDFVHKFHKFNAKMSGKFEQTREAEILKILVKEYGGKAPTDKFVLREVLIKATERAKKRHSMYKRLKYNCRSKTPNADRKFASSAFKSTLIYLGAAATAYGYTNAHQNEEFTMKSAANISFDISMSILFSKVIGLIYMNPEMPLLGKTLTGMTVGATYDYTIMRTLYNKWFGVSKSTMNAELSKWLEQFTQNEDIDHDQFLKEIEKLAAKIGKDQRLKEILTYLADAKNYSDYLVTPSNLPTVTPELLLYDATNDNYYEMKEILIDGLSQQLYEENKSGWLTCGSMGDDRFCWNRLWSFWAAPKGVAMSIVLYNSLCRVPNKAIALPLTYMILIGDRLINKKIGYKLRNDAIGI